MRPARAEMDAVNTELLNHTSLPPLDFEKEKVAVIVPYRNRKEHLLKFLTRLLPFLGKQTGHYVIIITEQAGDQGFNRGKLFNAAVTEIKKSPPGDQLHGINCYILHDVDKLPTSPSTVYECGQHVKQLATAFRTDKETRWLYSTFLGGATALKWEHIEQINGASNIFYGWGGEDDDLSLRLQLNNITVDRTVGDDGIFDEFDADHRRDENKDRIKLTTIDSVSSRWKNDGIKQTRYYLLNRFDYEFFIWLLVSI
ncbi:hypothetical protein SprV_0602227200 [Sparganum proliferum]